MNITRIDIPNSIHKFKQFYTTLSDVYLKHFNQYDIEVIHDNKKVKAGIDKDTQKIGDINIDNNSIVVISDKNNKKLKSKSKTLNKFLNSNIIE